MPEAVTVTRYRTFDGEEFATEAEARAHESEHFQNLLVGRSDVDIAAALRRDSGQIALADALERAGAVIARPRRAGGDLKRHRKGEETPAGGADASAADEAPKAAVATTTVPESVLAAEEGDL